MKYLIVLISAILLSCNSSNESKADSYNTKGNTEKAIHHYKLAIKEGSVEAMSKLAFLYSNQQQKDKAQKYLIMAYENGDVSSTEILSSNSLKDNNYQDVIKYSKKMADDGNKNLIYNLGLAYLQLEEYDLAIKYLKMDKESVYIKDPLGEAYYKKGDYTNAEKSWKSAIENHPAGAVNSHNKLLKLYIEQGRNNDYEQYKDYY